ncbi:MAG: DUF4331 domain-containing protein [Acidiferrobacterales bacterium]|nr:DUF4331 domain-containing protein [Acidiferrobacterales bacterium]
MKPFLKKAAVSGAAAALCFASVFSYASSHMDAPLITFDDAANTTDVYAFKSHNGDTSYLTTAVAVYPFEDPGIGPNKYNFDDAVRYNIHVATGDDLLKGKPTYTYQFRFNTQFKNQNTILQSYLGVINEVDDSAQNLTQNYSVQLLDHRKQRRSNLVEKGTKLLVPPNNQGIATPFYNQGNDGELPAKDGVSTSAELDAYTSQTIYQLKRGYEVFAGQRDDGFYGDIQSIFDLLQLRNPGKDSQGGFNVHTIALNIPISEIGGDQQVVGVWATTERKQVRVIRTKEDRDFGRWVQVGRQGNPLFNEGFVAIVDKDLYNRTQPIVDRKLFSKYAENPELATLLNALVIPGTGLNPAVTTERSDIAGIFIPDVIKVDLSTEPARLAGSGASHPLNPDDPGFSRLSVFGGDALTSEIQAGLPGFPKGTIPGGWPNGRRFGDDVVDIGVTALISDLRNDPLIIQGPAGDNVDNNDIGYNKVFPYAATPLNGRNHQHN